MYWNFFARSVVGGNRYGIHNVHGSSISVCVHSSSFESFGYSRFDPVCVEGSFRDKTFSKVNVKGLAGGV